MNLVDEIAKASTYLLGMVLSLTFHEFAHAAVAKSQGDDTAQDEGRLTLNPAAHIDPLGTILIPLLGALTNTLVIGWAKPVPITASRMRNKWSPVLVSLAGPGANLLICLILSIGLVVYQKSLTTVMPPESFFFPLIKLAYAMISMNAVLAFFNLIPVPPLDGAAMLEATLPPKGKDFYEAYVVPYGFMFLLLMMMTIGLPWIGRMASTYIAFCQGLAAIILG